MNESGKKADRRRWTSTVCTEAIMLSPLMSPNPAPAAVELHVANEFSMTYNDITGPGSNQSSLTEGFRYLDMFNFTGNGNLSGFDYNFNLGVKATDDRTNDPKTWSLTNLQGRATNGIHTLNLGDTFESFSQYALGTALKGGSYRFFDQKRNLPELIFVYGYAYPRWDSIYGDAETKVIDGWKAKASQANAAASAPSTGRDSSTAASSGPLTTPTARATRSISWSKEPTRCSCSGSARP